MRQRSLVKKRKDASTLYIKVIGNTAELLCSGCQKSLWGEYPFTITIASDETNAVIIKRLVRGWGECNGDDGDIRCSRCRKKGQTNGNQE